MLFAVETCIGGHSRSCLWTNYIGYGKSGEEIPVNQIASTWLVESL